MLGSITRDPIFCSKARILLQVKNIFFRSLMITKRLLDVVSCEIFIYMGPSVLLKKVNFHWDWI